MIIDRMICCALALAAPSLLGQTKVKGVTGSSTEIGTPNFDPLGEIYDDLPKMIRVQVEYIEVSHETLTAVMSDLKLTTDGMIRAHLGELVKKKEAKVIETMIVVARPGQKATTESIEEYIYPTEYDPALTPETVEVKAEEIEGEKTLKVEAPDLATGPTPTAFETRNLGSTLEVEPNVGANDKIIDLRFAPEIVYHVGNTVWSTWKDKRGTANIEMPKMYSIRTSTGVTVARGEYRLVSAQSPKGENGFPDFDRKLMLFVKCDLLTVGR